MDLPIPELEWRSLSMREQVIARLRQLNPDVVYREEYLNTLKDHALLTALEVAIQAHMRLDQDEHDEHMFNAGMKYQQERMEEERAQSNETFRMEEGDLIASSNPSREKVDENTKSWAMGRGNLL